MKTFFFRAAATRVLCVVMGSVVGGAGVIADAQTLESPPDPASLAASSDAPRGQTLDATIAAVGAYDGFDAPWTGLASGVRQAGPQYQLQSGVAWARRTKRAIFTVSDGVAMQYMPVLADSVGLYHGAAVGITLQLHRTRIDAREAAIISPFYSLIQAARPLDDAEIAAVAPATPDAVAIRSERTYSSRVAITQPLGRRTLVTASMRVDDTRFSAESLHQQDVDAGVRMTRRLTTGLDVVLGYRQDQATYWSTAPAGRTVAIVRTLDAGFEFRHDLRIVRRTTFHATSGVAQRQDPASDHQYDVVGSAGVTRQVARAWYATVDVTRGSQFIAGLQVPLFSNAAAVSVSGRLSRRIDLLVRADYTDGRLDIVSTGNHTDIRDAAARLRMAVTRRMSSSLEYLFSQYRFARTDILAAGLPPSFDGSAVRLRFDVALPLVR